MSRAAPQHYAYAALAVGLALGATAAAGTALLLYTGSGFLRAAGLLISSTIMAVAAGLWASGSEPVPLRARWLALGLALLAAGIFTSYWGEREGLRGVALGGALAVLLVLALPSYTAGLQLAGLHARSRDAGVAAAATAGAALGVLFATTILIQLLQPYGIYYGSAFVVSIASLLTRDGVLRAQGGDLDMRHHVTLITGVGSADQLGYTIARRFAEQGARVVVSARGAGIHDVAAALAAHGSVEGIAAELTRDDDVHALLDEVRNRHGRLDSLINAAGGLTHVGSIEDTTPLQWQAEIERNAGTALRVCRAALPLLRESRGAIVNFTSPAGVHALANLAAYSAAKAAVIALTRALALEEKSHGVRVNAIAPGMLDTPQNRAAAAPGAPFVPREDVAAVAYFLASPEARAISGQVLPVPGDTL